MQNIIEFNHSDHIKGIYTFVSTANSNQSFAQIHNFARMNYHVSHEAVKATLSYLVILGSIIEAQDEFGIYWRKKD
jgi:metal-dependent hydrolase (beta-lactamase superfamily II)